MPCNPDRNSTVAKPVCCQSIMTMIEGSAWDLLVRYSPRGRPSVANALLIRPFDGSSRKVHIVAITTTEVTTGRKTTVRTIARAGSRPLR